MTVHDIEKQALILAKANKKHEPKILDIYWFPSAKEIRLIEVEDNLPKSLGGIVDVFYFAPDPAKGIHAPIGMGLIRPEEVKQLKLPKSWGKWDSAKKLKIA